MRSNFIHPEGNAFAQRLPKITNDLRMTTIEYEMCGAYGRKENTGKIFSQENKSAVGVRGRTSHDMRNTARGYER